jgi:outer membrane lipoprotein SlyB
MSATLRLGSYLLAISVLIGIDGCAPANPPKVAPQPSAVSTGTILSIRAVNPQAAVEPLRAALLAGGSGGSHDNQDRPLVEFIVRADDGTLLSIVQQNEAGFRTGDRVVIMRDNKARLERPG